MSDIKIQHNQFIGIYENILNKETCNKVIKIFDADLNKEIELSGDQQFYRAEMERHDYSIGYLSSDLNHELVSIVNHALDKCIELYAKEFWTIKQLKATSLNIKLQKTPPRGGYHVWHCEQGQKEPSRVLAWTIYLNDIPDGEGETEFLWQGLRVKPKAGTVSIFPAAFTHTHRGNPVYSCDKYIATGWYTLYE